MIDHSPGPWRTRVDATKSRLIIEAADGRPVAVMIVGDRPDEATANAAIIAWAPQMLAALEMAEHDLMAHDGWIDVFSLLSRIRAVMAERP